MELEFLEQLAVPLFDSLCNLAHWLTGDRIKQKTWCRRPIRKHYEDSSRFSKAQISAWVLGVPYPAQYLPDFAQRLIARNTSWLEDEDMDVNLTAAHADIPEAMLLQHENQ